MRELVKGTGMNFEPKEWSADKAYLSVENIESVFSQGGTPYVAFKENSTGEAGGMFQKLFHLYQFNKQDYMEPPPSQEQRRIRVLGGQALVR